MNKYLEKIADQLGNSPDSSKVHPFRTMALMGALSLPFHAAGAWAGHKVGLGYGGASLKIPEALVGRKLPFASKALGTVAKIDGPALGQFVGAGIGGGIADYAVLRHEQKKENE